MKTILAFVIFAVVKSSLAEVNEKDNGTIASSWNDTEATATSLPVTPRQTSQPDSPVCLQPQVKGDCKALLRRYFYDHTTGVCREFFYGGCGGNENNFRNKSECEATCSALNGVGASASATEEPEENATVVVKRGQCPPANAPVQNRTEGSVTIPCSPSCTDDSECPGEKLCCNVDACGRAICMAPMAGTEGIGRSKSLAVATPVNPICLKILDAGPCRAYFPRWGFDGSGCVQFVYGGCQGNENNFETRGDCEKACGIATTPTECPLIKIVPPPGCEIITGTKSRDGCPKPEIRCTEGACASNPCPSPCDNCINEPKECFTTPCPQYRCELKENCGSPRSTFPLPPPLPTPPPLPDSIFQPLHACALVLCAPNTVCREIQGLATCVPNIAAMAQTRASSGAQVTCQLQPDTGRCRASMDRWFFNVVSSRCERFLYGGCGGNENNFESRQSCESYCAVFINTANTEKEGQCPQPEGPSDQVGICANECSFDAQCPGDRKCCSNACGGRVCMATSTVVANASAGSLAIMEAEYNVSTNDVKRTPPRTSSPNLEIMRRCRQQPDGGPCKAAFQRWFFDIVTGECIQFTYGGCAGNSNNFETQQQCQQVCDQVPPCPQYVPPVPPPGCAVVSWTGVDGCPAVGFKCTEGECSRIKCPGNCDFCVNEPKQCIRAPCPQYRCQANDTCLVEQCALVRCANGLVCQVVNGSVACLPNETASTNRWFTGRRN